MNPEVAKQLIDVFEKRELNCFTHTIINDVLHVYYTRLINPVEEKSIIPKSDSRNRAMCAARCQMIKAFYRLWQWIRRRRSSRLKRPS